MRARDCVRFSKYIVPKFVGYVGSVEGKDVGAVAIVWDAKERPYLCFEISDTLRHSPLLMHRWAKKMIAAGLQACGELYAVEDSKEPTAPKWLARLGLKPTDETLKGERLWRA